MYIVKQVQKVHIWAEQFTDTEIVRQKNWKKDGQITIITIKQTSKQTEDRNLQESLKHNKYNNFWYKKTTSKIKTLMHDYKKVYGASPIKFDKICKKTH